jgi:hypothetical protein
MAFSFICAVDDSMMICFRRKRCLSVSTTYAIRPQDRGDEKIGSLKYFEIRGIQEKEPPLNKSTYYSPYQSDRHGHLPEAGGEILIHYLIGLSKSVPDRQQSAVSA